MPFARSQAAKSFKKIKLINSPHGLERITCWSAFDPAHKRWVLVREWREGLDPTNRAIVVTGFRREKDMARLLQTGGASKAPIVALYNYQADGNDSAERIFAEYIPGLWLSHCLQQRSLGETQALTIACDLARAVAAHNQCGIVHLNIQPATVLVRRAKGNAGVIVGAKLDEYSLAYHPSQPIEPEKASTLVRDYCPPDLLNGASPQISHDLYNIGLLLWEMISGQPYHVAKRNSPTETPLRVATPATQAIIAKALHADPDKRYQYPDLMLSDLEKALSQVEPNSHSPADQAIRGGRFRLRKLIALLLGCITVIVLGIYLSKLQFLSRNASGATSTVTAPTYTLPAQLPARTAQGAGQAVQPSTVAVAPSSLPLSTSPAPTSVPQVTLIPSPSFTPSPSPFLTSTPLSIEEAADLSAAQNNAYRKDYLLILAETFDRGRTTQRSWPEGDKAKRLLHYRYEITLDQPHALISELWNGVRPNLKNDYILELTVRFPSLKPIAEVGLVFDAQDEKNKGWYYTLRSDGAWRIYRDNKLVYTGNQRTTFAINPETNYSLWVWRRPDATIFFFNGIAVAKTKASHYEGGRVGVVAIAGETVPSLVVADTFWVRRRR